MKTTGLLFVFLFFLSACTRTAPDYGGIICDFDDPKSNLEVVFSSASLDTADKTISIEGVVLDHASGDPLPHANVVLLGTMNGVATDGQGQFSLKNVGYEENLLVSFIGFAILDTSVVDVIAHFKAGEPMVSREPAR